MAEKRTRKTGKTAPKAAAKKPKKPGKKAASGRPARRRLNPADPHFISGIYNYCDRWCERCEFSHRCFNFASSEQYFGDDPEARDMNNQKFWETLSKIHEDARKMLEKAIKKLGVPDEQSVDAADAYEKHLERRAAAMGQKETKAALTYSHVVDEWFNNELRAPLQHVRDLEKQVEAGMVKVADAKGELVRLNDCVEVIRWYQHFIYVKLGRAFSSKVEEEENPNFAAIGDGEGTAKVALIAVERSIAAWTAMQEMFPEKTDTIIEVLVQLDRIRRGVDAKFPKARAFKRPGFDEKEKGKR